MGEVYSSFHPFLTSSLANLAPWLLFQGREAARVGWEGKEEQEFIF